MLLGRIQDFLVGGGTYPRGGGAPGADIWFGKISGKLHEIEKYLGRGGVGMFEKYSG